MGSLVYVAALGIVLVPIIYLVATGLLQSRLPQLRGKRICLLIAHPDDEAMFFAPTVLALTRPETGNHVRILCLSTGNADGLGEARKKELVKSGMLLGLKNEDDVLVLDNPRDFPDSMTTRWDHQKISSLLCSTVAPGLSRQHAGAQPPSSRGIDVLITFDASGVSSHPNHTSLFHGARTFIATLAQSKSESPCPVDLYTLTTVGFLRKYSSIADIVVTACSWATGTKSHDAAHPEQLVFMNSLFGDGASRSTAYSAMTDAHKSQMVWFRYGWILLSRYMMINELRLEHVGEAKRLSSQ